MKLSRTERWILSNQYRILEKLEGADYFSVRHALEYGYERHYPECASHIEDKELSIAESNEIVEILEMFCAIELGGKRHNHDTTKIRFDGFDGNNERQQLSYAQYLITKDTTAFTEVRTRVLNSHMPTLDRYRRMLAAWREWGDDRHRLPPEALDEIAEAQ